MEPIIPKSSISIFDFKNCNSSKHFHTFMLVLQNGTYLWKGIWHNLSKLQMQSSSETADPLMGIYPTDKYAHVRNDMWTRLYM